MSAIALGLDRTVLELKMYSREKEAVFFSFLFPILLLALFSVIFGSQFDGADNGMTAGGYFLPGMLSAGVLLTSFQTMAMSVTAERDDGTLKRLRATPMPPVAYFLGKVGLVAISSTVQVALLLLVARLVLRRRSCRRRPTAGRCSRSSSPLGVFGGTVLGIAYSSMATARTVGAVVIGPMLVLQFISGVYIAFDDVPQWLQQVASVFPLKWIAQGMRSVFYPDQLASAEMAGSWETGRTALVLSPGPWAGWWCACSPSSGSSAAPREPPRARMSDVTATGSDLHARSSARCGGGSSRTGTPSSPIVWAAAVVVTLLDDPGPHGRGPVARAARRSSPLAYAVLGARAMTHRDLRWAVAYQVVAWSALLGHPVGRPEHPGLAALLHALPPAVGDGADPVGRHRHRVVVVAAFSLVRWAQPTSPPTASPRSSSPAPSRWACPSRSGCSSTGSSARPRAAPRRSTSCAPPRPGSLPRSATAGCTRSASASRARSTTPSRRGSPRWSPSPARRRPRWPAATPPRQASGSRSSSTRHPTTSTRPG